MAQPSMLLLLAAMIELALAAPQSTNETPSPNTTATPDEALTFGPEPRGRGTIGILLSCTATFVFCVWTVVHPNILQGTSTWNRFCHKATLVMISVCVPEGIIVCSFGEWCTARSLHEAWKTGRYIKKPDYLGMDGAFFVVMGGFVVIPESEISASTSSECGQTLTPEGFLECIHQHWITEASFKKADIVDKAKASNIVKLFSGLQALWLIASCCARWRAHLALTLLEIHVVIQVVCTIFIFCFWWSKPLDVMEPLIVRVSQRNYEHLFRTQPSPPDEHHTEESPTPDPEKSINVIHSSPEGTSLEHHTFRCASNFIAAISKALHDIFISLVPLSLSGNTGQKRKHSSTASAKRISMELAFVLSVGALHTAAWNVQFPTPVERLLWQISSLGMCIFALCASAIAVSCGYHVDLIDIMEIFKFYESDGEPNGKPNAIILFFSAVVKSINIIGRGAKERSREVKSPLARGCCTVLHVFGISIFVFSVLCYAVCALYIMVESYISLRKPPVGAFETPRLDDYWPRFV